MLAKLVAELDESLPPLLPDEVSHPITVLEASLPYLRNCIKENFRINPVFTMPLARRIMAKEGVVIDGEHIKQGVSVLSLSSSIANSTSCLFLGVVMTLIWFQTSVAICNHAFHHNPAVWGDDHNIFRPSRWDEPATNSRSRLLMHFGLGGRQCIGKTIATTNIYKLTSSLLTDYEFELAAKPNTFQPSEPWSNSSPYQKSDLPSLISVGISDLEASLMVRCKKRMPASEKF